MSQSEASVLKSEWGLLFWSQEWGLVFGSQSEASVLKAEWGLVFGSQNGQVQSISTVLSSHGYYPQQTKELDKVPGILAIVFWYNTYILSILKSICIVTLTFDLEGKGLKLFPLVYYVDANVKSNSLPKYFRDIVIQMHYNLDFWPWRWRLYIVVHGWLSGRSCSNHLPTMTLTIDFEVQDLIFSMIEFVDAHLKI